MPMSFARQGGKFIDCKSIASAITDEVKKRACSFFQSTGTKPRLQIYQVGNREDSACYVRMKLKAAEKIGIVAEHLQLPSDISKESLLKMITESNENQSVHGIIVQLPLDSLHKICESEITQAVSPAKDVDGFHALNIGKLAKGNDTGFIPCTAKGIMEILKESNVKVEGSRAVVVGRSQIVGLPTFNLLNQANATVSIAHSKTRNLSDLLKEADIVVVAIGRGRFIQGSWLKPGCVVIDVGTNAVPDVTKPGGFRWEGDVDVESSLPVVSLITPVPGGVGPLTVAMLLSNTVLAAERNTNTVTRKELFQKIPILNSAKKKHLTDSEIAQSTPMKDILLIAKECGVLPKELIPFGHYKAKLSLDILKRITVDSSNSRYVIVTGMNPTPLGEGKSLTTLGIAQALAIHKQVPAFAVIRQPSQGPTFGLKGGAAGGGFSQVQPMVDFNLHLNGDIHALTAAHNLVAAALDTRIFHENTQTDEQLWDRLVPKVDGKRNFSPIMIKRLSNLGIETNNPEDLSVEQISKFVRLDVGVSSITWKRVVDINDRFLRSITIGQSPSEKGFSRNTGYELTVLSEMMAILALATGRDDLRNRLGHIVLAQSKRDGSNITIDDLGVTGALELLLNEALMPNLMQSIEGSPVLVHAGPFANVAHGNSSIIADKIAIALSGDLARKTSKPGFVITEAGFGAEIGLEKAINIKSRVSGIYPSAIVLVCTVRAVKANSNSAPKITPGIPLHEAYTKENLELLKEGSVNLIKQIQNSKRLVAENIPVLVAINRFSSDTEAELNYLKDVSISAGASSANIINCWAEGGLGAIDIAESLIELTQTSNQNVPPPRFLYQRNEGIEAKINAIAKEMYGAAKVSFSEEALLKLNRFERDPLYSTMSICMSKTQYSLSHDSKLIGAPTGFTLPVSDLRANVGAGFITVFAGSAPLSLPGLPTRPAYLDMGIDPDGKTYGLS